MALPSDEIRAEYAESVPVYVRAEGDAWALVLTATDEVLSTHETPREALTSSLDREDVKARVKRANLRSDGEPDGVWRWLDASAEEDEPIGESRITAGSLWEMAAGLNMRASAIPINGGGAPDGGYKASDPHGDAYNHDGAHPANGWAHVGAIVIESDGRTHLYLYGELLPEIAREVDRGRLAYGSIFMGFASVDEANNFAVIGAVLISHALTNDPAVTTLTAGSERTRRGAAVRSRRTTTMSQTHLEIARDKNRKPAERVRAAIEHASARDAISVAARGPIGDMLVAVMEALGISEADLLTNPWAVEDSMYGLVNAAKFEAKMEAKKPAGPPPPAAGGSASQRSRAARAKGEEPEEPVEGAGEDDAKAAITAWGREVLGKPEATYEEVMAELDARKAEIGAALGTDTAEAGEGEEEPETEEEDEEAAEREPDVSTPEARAQVRALIRGGKAKPRAVEAAARALAKRSERDDMRAWILDELAKIKRSLDPKTLEEYVDIGVTAGQPVVRQLVKALNQPPQVDPMQGAAAAGARADANPETQTAAYDACMDQAQRELDAEEAKRAKAERRQPRAHERHDIRARAQKLAREQFPELFVEAAAPAR